MVPIILCTCFLLTASSTQTDWTGGPGVSGPVSDFGTAFHQSDSIVYGASGMILPQVHISGQGAIDDWTEHTIEDNPNIDGRNAIRPGDFDGDGDFDLAGVIDGQNILRLYRNTLVETGVDTFVQQVDYDIDVHEYCFTWVGDFDDDGDPDVVVPGDSTVWFENTGSWNFTKRFIGYVDHVADTANCDVGDVDNDGDMDVVNGIHPFVLWRNNGDGTFACESISEGRFCRVKLGDLNNDAYLDVMQADWVFLNNAGAGPTVFPTTPSWTSGYGAGQVDGTWLADFDGDNDVDLLMCRVWHISPWNYAIYWYENDGTGLDYTQHEIADWWEAKDNADGAIAEDMDLDGRNDVVGGYRQVSYFHQYPVGTFNLIVVDSTYGQGSFGCHWVYVENLGRQPGGLKFTKDIMASCEGKFHWWENGLDSTLFDSGWLVSSVLDAFEPVEWQRFAWYASRPSGTGLDFYVRTGATAGECLSNPWQGPISVATGVERDSVELDTLTTSGHRYFQYRVVMDGGNQPGVAPVTYEVRVVYDNAPPEVHDVGATAILAPAGMVNSGQSVTPRAVIENYGTQSETFPVTFRIGADYDRTVQRTLAAGAVDTVAFSPDWVAEPEGTYPTLVFTNLTGDEVSSNDSVAGQAVVISPNHDVGVTQILAPKGNIGVGSSVDPLAVVVNLGPSQETFDVVFRVSNGYEETVGSVTLPSGQTDTIQFPFWLAQPNGAYVTTAFTVLAGDQNPDNDTATGEVVVMPPTHDVGATGIVVPTMKMILGEEIFPVVRVKNHGTFVETFDVEVLIRDEMLSVVFQEQEQLTALDPGDVREFAFTSHFWTAESAGDYTVRARTLLAGDAVPSNDEFGPEALIVLDVPSGPPGWTEMESMPSGPSGKAVKRGGWMAKMGDLLYAGKGYKTQDFYSYDPFDNDWVELNPLPPGNRGGRIREAKKGSRGVSDGENTIYYTAGNNTLSFFEYDPAEDTWYALPDVPEGPRRKNVKGGNDMAYVVLDDTGWVYLMKGYKTEFYRFNTVSETWDTLADVPASRGKMKYGSWLVHDGANHMYAHEANYYNRATNEHFMYKYDIAADTWFSEVLPGMPLNGLHGGRVRKKKSKDGGSADWYDGCIYALKGGNTQQFWQCTVEADSWTEFDTLPTYGTTGRKRRVKYGAKLVHWSSGVFFTMKGNKTRELWRYKPGVAIGPSPERRGAAMAGLTGVSGATMTVRPNPLAGGVATVNYSLPGTGTAVLSVCDVVGRVVLSRSIPANRAGAVNLDLDKLARGVYLVRLETGDVTATRQLVLE